MDKQENDIKASRKNGAFGFCRQVSQRSKNQKSHFLPMHQMKIMAIKNIN